MSINTKKYIILYIMQCPVLGMYYDHSNAPSWRILFHDHFVFHVMSHLYGMFRFVFWFCLVLTSFNMIRTFWMWYICPTLYWDMFWTLCGVLVWIIVFKRLHLFHWSYYISMCDVINVWEIVLFDYLYEIICMIYSHKWAHVVGYTSRWILCIRFILFVFYYIYLYFAIHES